MAEDIEAKVKSIIAGRLAVTEDQIVPEAKIMEDLGADSLDTVELVMEFEEAFGISVPDEDAEKMTTVGKVFEYIRANSKQG